MNVLVYTTSMGHPTLKRFSDEIVKGFADLGCIVVSADLNDVSSMITARKLLLNGYIDLSVGFNNNGIYMVDPDGRCIYEYIDTPFVSIMLDAPYNVATGNLDFKCKKYFICVLDRTHVEALRLCYPDMEISGIMFLPLGGTTNTYDIFQEKIYDVVYSGELFKGFNDEPAWHHLENNKHVIEILDDVVDLLLAQPISTLDAFKYVLVSRGLFDREYLTHLTPYFFCVFHYVKHRRRYNGMKMLADCNVKVDVFGKGWNDVPFSDKLCIHGPIPYEENLDVLAKAKVIFQDQAEFNNGAHDRVLSSMLSGAVVVSEYSTYLKEIFENGKNIFLYDWKNGMTQMQVIDELVNDENMRSSAVVSAYRIAHEKHQWISRAQSILEMVSLEM